MIMSFAQVLRLARFRCRWGQRECARLIGVKYGYMLRWETGKSAPAAPQMRRLESAFGVPAGTWREYEARNGQTNVVARVGCTIPMRTTGHTGVTTYNKLWHEDGSLFCIACDVRLPEGCTGKCDPARSEFALCPLADECPCANPATPERERTFKEWCTKRKER